MKTVISERVRNRLDRVIVSWNLCDETKAACIEEMAEQLDVSEYVAIELLNECTDVTEILDELGMEVVDDESESEPANVYTMASNEDEDLSDWIPSTISIFTTFLMGVLGSLAAWNVFAFIWGLSGGR